MEHPAQFEEIMQGRISNIKTIAFYALKAKNPNATDAEIDQEVKKVLLSILEK